MKYSSIKHYPVADQLGIIGTNKGLIVYSFPDQGKPEQHSIHFLGFAVTMVYVDERTDRWWIGLSHKHWGQKLHYTDDQGNHWNEVDIPRYNHVTLANGNTAKLKQIWCMAHAGNDKPGELWLGTDPGGLFYSMNNGDSFELVESLWNHPSHQSEGQWFGAGSDSPFIHTIVVNPENSNHVYIAVSCAGIFESKDGGITWHPKNSGLVAAYLPNPSVDVGHDPHLLVMSSNNPEIMWQQNHCGIFNTKNGGDAWNEVSKKDKLPNYGFCIAIDEDNPNKAWVIPVESDSQRVAPNLQLQVFTTNDFGSNWTSDSEGLSKENSFDIVLRHSFKKKNELFLFGTTNGNVYYRRGTEKWQALSTNLTKVNAIVIS